MADLYLKERLVLRNRHQDHLAHVLDRHDITFDKLVTHLKGKLLAKETKFFSDKGLVMETREVEDHGTQIAANDRLTKLRLLADRPPDSGSGELRPDNNTFRWSLLTPEQRASFWEHYPLCRPIFGQPVLAEAPHQDDGRAGSGESLQTVPVKPGVPSDSD